MIQEIVQKMVDDFMDSYCEVARTGKPMYSEYEVSPPCFGVCVFFVPRSLRDKVQELIAKEYGTPTLQEKVRFKDPLTN